MKIDIKETLNFFDNHSKGDKNTTSIISIIGECMNLNEGHTEEDFEKLKETEIYKIFKKAENFFKKKYGNGYMDGITVPLPCPKNGFKDVKIMFINERPGIKGAGSDSSKEICFDNNDGSATRFKRLFQKNLKEKGITRKDIFITNSCLWCPNNMKNPKTTKKDIEEGKEFLKETIDLMNPKIIVPLGMIAVRALKVIYPNSKLNQYKKFKGNIGKFIFIEDKKWIIYPMYHTSSRGIKTNNGRPEDKQMKDWSRISELLKERSKIIKLLPN
jgi:uracil-DNA glycosylase family 4